MVNFSILPIFFYRKCTYSIVLLSLYCYKWKVCFAVDQMAFPNTIEYNEYKTHCRKVAHFVIQENVYNICTLLLYVASILVPQARNISFNPRAV